MIIGGLIYGLSVITETKQTLIGILCIFSGIITGILFLAGAVVIDLLDRIVVNQESRLQEMDAEN